jgi:hypothetical protein
LLFLGLLFMYRPAELIVRQIRTARGLPVTPHKLAKPSPTLAFVVLLAEGLNRRFPTRLQATLCVAALYHHDTLLTVLRAGLN